MTSAAFSPVNERNQVGEARRMAQTQDATAQRARVIAALFGISGTELARRLGVSRTRVSVQMSGARHPGPRLMAALLEAAAERQAAEAHR
jgi:transcriptional regulator with XRE-family HTH domain